MLHSYLEAVINKQFKELTSTFKPEFGNTSHIQVVKDCKEIFDKEKSIKSKMENAKGAEKLREEVSLLKRSVINLLKNT